MNEQPIESELEPPKCAICQDYTFDSYMLRHTLWAEAGLYSNQNAHPSCVALRLGRPLTPEDFTDAPINDVANSMRSPVLSIADAFEMRNPQSSKYRPVSFVRATFAEESK